MWKRWLPFALVAPVFCLMIAAVWAVRHRTATQSAVPAARVIPAEWPYKEAGNAPATVPPVFFRTDHPPADAFNLRPTGAEEMTGRAINVEPRAPRTSSPAQDLPPGTKPLEFNGATVYYEPLGH